mmetsp:Transcript_70396/g.187488  ORF Transcript_70396/g.187488 Transcript_70396/m.187488 type:complete len:253 (-) Transcript_70396:1348-2106(-)
MRSFCPDSLRPTTSSPAISASSSKSPGSTPNSFASLIFNTFIVKPFTTLWLQASAFDSVPGNTSTSYLNEAGRRAAGAVDGGRVVRCGLGREVGAGTGAGAGAGEFPFFPCFTSPCPPPDACCISLNTSNVICVSFPNMFVSVNWRSPQLVPAGKNCGRELSGWTRWALKTTEVAGSATPTIKISQRNFHRRSEKRSRKKSPSAPKPFDSESPFAGAPTSAAALAINVSSISISAAGTLALFLLVHQAPSLS